METLYALAGMFPHNASNHNSTDLDGKSLPDNSSVLQDLEDNASDALQGHYSFSISHSYLRYLNYLLFFSTRS